MRKEFHNAIVSVFEKTPAPEEREVVKGCSQLYLYLAFASGWLLAKAHMWWSFKSVSEAL